MKSLLAVLIAVALSYGITISGMIYQGEFPHQIYEPGVIVTLTPGGKDTTDINGLYATTVPSGWTGTIVPVKLGKAFKIALANGPYHQDINGGAGYINVTVKDPIKDTIWCYFNVANIVGAEGRVKDSTGQGVGGVTVFLEPSPAFFVSNCPECCGPYPIYSPTESDGYYLLGLYPGWMGYICFRKTGMEFSLSQGVLGANMPQKTSLPYTYVLAKPRVFYIEGWVKAPSGKVISNVIVTLGGCSDTTDSMGHYLLKPTYGTRLSGTYF